MCDTAETWKMCAENLKSEQSKFQPAEKLKFNFSAKIFKKSAWMTKYYQKANCGRGLGGFMYIYNSFRSQHNPKRRKDSF